MYIFFFIFFFRKEWIVWNDYTGKENTSKMIFHITETIHFNKNADLIFIFKGIFYFFDPYFDHFCPLPGA